MSKRQTGQTEKIVVPDIGGAENIPIIEILVKEGDSIQANDSLITLEGDKATMEVPSPMGGTIEKILVKVGDKVSQGHEIVLLKVEATQQAEPAQKLPAKEEATSGANLSKSSETTAAPKTQESANTAVTEAPIEFDEEEESDIHAGPGVRRLAHELGIDLTKLLGSGVKGRVTKEDIQNYVKQKLLTAATATTGLPSTLPPLPAIDFGRFGEIETRPLSRIQKISGSTLHRNWVSIPHITQFGEADVTELEAFREQQKDKAAKENTKLTPIVFIMKAVVAALRAFPHFNASLDATGEQLIYKKYFHIGVAVDTKNGLVVPVIRNVEQKGILELAKELSAISTKVREQGLSLSDMQGGCFTISSLGGIGGTAFTPIINAPEVAILGVSQSTMKPVYCKEEAIFKPRLMLPLSLSYDHRVIDGADGARFMVYLTNLLADIRTLLL